MFENLIIAIPAFFLALALLIIIHEFGHYWVARKVGVKVIRFAVGFGKPLWRYQRSPEDTEFVIAAIPLGGYVSMLDERQAPVPDELRSQAFNTQKLRHRVAIVAAGPIFNFIFAVFAYWMMFVVGLPGLVPTVGAVAPTSIAQQAGIKVGDRIIAIDDQMVATWGSASIEVIAKNLNQQSIHITLEDEWQVSRQVSLLLPEVGDEFGKTDALKALGLTPLRPKVAAIIGQVLVDSPAQQAGLQAGDKLLRADGQAIDDWMAWVVYVRERPEIEIELLVARAQTTLNLQITPARMEEMGEVFGRIGASAEFKRNTIPDELLAIQRYNPAEAMVEAVKKTWQMSVMSLQVMGKMVTGQVSLDNLSGPLTIAQYAGYSAQSGLASFLAFLAIISLSLGVLNLLPIPMLDGGHLLYYFIEFIKGSPVSNQVQELGMRIGMFMILMLMSVALYNDFIRLFG